MKTLISVVALSALAACGSKKDVDLKNASVDEVVAASKDAQKLDPGQWKTTVEIVSVDMPGLPPAQKAMMDQQMAAHKTTTVENCVTKADAEKPPAKMFGGDGQCTFERYQVSGGKMDGKMTCAPKGMPGKMEMSMTGSFSSTKYAVETESKMSGAPGLPGDVTTKTRITGERVGECKKPA